MSKAIKHIRESPLPSNESPADGLLYPSNQLAIGLVRALKGELPLFCREGTANWLMLYCAEGSGEFTHKHLTLSVRKGDLVLIPPEMKASLELGPESGRWEIFFVSFFPYSHWFSLLQWPEQALEIRLLHFSESNSQSRLRKDLLKALQIQSGAERNWKTSAMNVLERLLLYCDAATPVRQGSPVDSRVLFAVNYLSKHLAEHITLTVLAQVVGVSVPRLVQLFRKHIHLSPHRFLEKQRIAHARQVLETTNEAVSTVAAAAGYSDPFHFARQFKKHIGCSPSEYRKRQSPFFDEKRAAA